MDHVVSSSPNLRAKAVMQASTAFACFRKLSDWVNSVSNSHADSRVAICRSFLCVTELRGSFVLGRYGSATHYDFCPPREGARLLHRVHLPRNRSKTASMFGRVSTPKFG